MLLQLDSSMSVLASVLDQLAGAFVRTKKVSASCVDFELSGKFGSLEGLPLDKYDVFMM